MPSASAERGSSASGRTSFDAFMAPDPKAARNDSIVSAATRVEAFERFESLGPPGGKPGRDWKYDYARIGSDLPPSDLSPVTGEAYEKILPSESISAWLSIVGPWPRANALVGDQRFAAGAKALYVNDLEGPLDETTRAMLASRFGGAVSWRDDKFASLAVAFQRAGLLIRVPAETRIERPILLTRSAAMGRAFPYVLVVLEAGAKATIVEDAYGPGGFTSGIVEAFVGERAELDYVSLQRTGPDATVLMHRGAVCDADATCRWFLAELGAGLSRSAVSTRLAGRGAVSEISGLFFNDGDQHVDLSSLVEHAVGDSTSRTTIKSAATDRGQGRYLGNIRIQKSANGSDAALKDDALLLSKRAHIDSVPALEIASNDVRAFHGATVGSIDEEELFYAQSRGIERAAAERMIALGFFEPVVASFPLEPVREHLRAVLGVKAGA